jgi:hypothetical protein
MNIVKVRKYFVNNLPVTFEFRNLLNRYLQYLIENQFTTVIVVFL